MSLKTDLGHWRTLFYGSGWTQCLSLVCYSSYDSLYASLADQSVRTLSNHSASAFLPVDVLRRLEYKRTISPQLLPFKYSQRTPNKPSPFSFPCQSSDSALPEHSQAHRQGLESLATHIPWSSSLHSQAVFLLTINFSTPAFTPSVSPNAFTSLVFSCPRHYQRSSSHLNPFLPVSLLSFTTASIVVHDRAF